MNRLKPADTLNILFSLFLLILTIIYHAVIRGAGYLMLIYGSLIFFQLILSRLGRINQFLELTHDIFFPVVCVLIIFDSLGLIVHSINPQDIDYLLIRADYRILGGYPTVFLERFIYSPLTDILEVAYSTYYLMPVTLGIALKLRKDKSAFEKSLFLILLCFYLSYIGYIIFPALGPRYTMDHLQSKAVVGFLVSKPIQDMLNLLEGVKRDAFPSGHTAIALTVLILSWKYARNIFRILLVPVILLIFATVYCRYHYFVDVIGGIILVVVTFTVGEVYYKFWTGRQSGSSV
ncbi:MAG: phosphatase PAP2 family protein [Dissulfurispiraceae bacterium]|jgi:membrane-associated phospholipid phosphatase